MPAYFRFGFGPFRFSQRLGGRRHRGQMPGCLALLLLTGVVLAFGWPLLLPGAWKALEMDNQAS